MSKMLINEASLYNGISQQNNELRLESQVEDATNARFSVAHGIEKRPACLSVTTEAVPYGDACKVHPVDIDEDNQYLLVFSEDTGTKSHQAFGVDGSVLPIITADSAVDTYIDTGSTPDKNLRLTTVLSTTIVTNKSVTTALTGTSTSSLGSDKYIWFKNGVQQVERSANINGNVWTFAKQTDNDTKAIVDDFMTYITSLAGYSGIRYGDSVVKVTKDDAGDFTLTVNDSYGDTTMVVAPLRGTARENLPPKATDDEIVKIVSDDTENADYYLKYDESSSSWFETVGEGVQTDLDQTTMPHQIKILVDDGAGTITGTPNQKYFYIEPISWVSRTVGDEDNAPSPSFIGQTINDVFYFKNRLGFLSLENIICSAIDDIYNFFPTTVKEVLDDDPIDLSVSTTKSVILEYAVPFPDSMAILGNNQQYSLHSDGKPFTSQNATVDNTTSYNVSDLAKPQSVGSSVYMTVPMDSFSAVREYAVVPDSLVTEASDVTGHVPRFIPDSIKQMIPENNLEYIFLIDKESSVEDRYIMWVYAFFWQGNQKVQSSWSKWDFWFKPLGGWVFDGKLHLLGKETINGVESTVLISLGLETKAVSVQNYLNSEPLIDRLQLYADNSVGSEAGQAVLEVDLATYNAFEGGIVGSDFILADRLSGQSGEYVRRFESGGKYYGVFNLKVTGKIDADVVQPSVLIGQYKIGGIL